MIQNDIPGRYPPNRRQRAKFRPDLHYRPAAPRRISSFVFRDKRNMFARSTGGRGSGRLKVFMRQPKAHDSELLVNLFHPENTAS
jgi:hypothetical protein